MSADNYTMCPLCEKNWKTEHEAKVAEKERNYGIVDVEKFLQLHDAARAPMVLDKTLREDYEIGISNGEFIVSFSCSCPCGFHWESTTCVVLELTPSPKQSMPRRTR